MISALHASYEFFKDWVLETQLLVEFPTPNTGDVESAV